MEISLIILFGWLGYFTPAQDNYPSWEDQWQNLSNWDKGRMGVLGLVALIMNMNYLLPLVTGNH